MEFVLLCLCLGAILTIPGIDARNVKLVPIQSKTINTKGATHEISRYIIVPDGRSDGPNEDVTSKKIQFQTIPLARSSGNGKLNHSNLFRISAGVAEGAGDVDNTHSKVILETTENTSSDNAPGLIKYHLVLGGKTEADNDQSEGKDTNPLDLLTGHSEAINTSEHYTADKKVTQNEEAGRGIGRNSKIGESNANDDSTNGYHQIRGEISDAVPNVDGTEEVQKTLKAETEVENVKLDDQRLSEESAGDHNNFEHYQTKTITQTMHNPTKITDIKLEELPIKWDNTLVSGIGFHPLLSSIAINKSFTLPGQRGRFKLIHEDDDDIDTVIFKHSTTDPVTVGRTHYYVNKYSIDHSNKKTTDDSDPNNDLSLKSTTMKITDQSSRFILGKPNNRNNTRQSSLAKSDLISSSTPNSHTETSKINSGNTIVFTKSHTVSSSNYDGGIQSTNKTSKIIRSSSSSDDGSKQVHTLYEYLPGSSSTIENNVTGKSNDYSEIKNTNSHHTVVAKYVTTNTNKEPTHSATNISLQKIEGPTPKETKTLSTVVSRSHIRQEPKLNLTNVIVTKSSSNIKKSVQAIPLHDEASGFVSVLENSEDNLVITDQDNLKSTSNVIKITKLLPDTQSQLKVMPLKHVTDMNDSSHIKRVKIIPTINTNNIKNTNVISKTNQEDHSNNINNYLVKNNNDGTENLVGRTSDPHNMSSNDTVHISSTKTDSQINKFELTPTVDKSDTITTIVTKTTNEEPLSAQNKEGVESLYLPINEVKIVPVVDKTVPTSFINEPSNDIHVFVSPTKKINGVKSMQSHINVQKDLGNNQGNDNKEEKNDAMNNSGESYPRARTAAPPINGNEAPDGLNKTSSSSNEITIIPKDDKNTASKTEIRHAALKSTHSLNVLNYFGAKYEYKNKAENDDTTNAPGEESLRIGSGATPVNQDEAPNGVTTTSPTPMRFEQSENISAAKVITTDDNVSYKSDESEVLQVRRDSISGAYPIEENEARSSTIINRDELTDTKSEMANRDDNQFLGVANIDINYGSIRNNQYDYTVPKTNYPLNTIGYSQFPSQVFGGKTTSDHNQLLHYLLNNLISRNIIPEINAYCASLVPGVDRDEGILQIINKYLQQLGIYGQLSLKQCHLVAQHLVQLIQGHRSKKYDFDDRYTKPMVVPNSYYTTPYAYGVAPISLQYYLLDGINVNVVSSLVCNLFTKVHNIITYLRSLGVPEAVIFQFISEVRRHLRKEIIQTLMTECQTLVCNGLAQSIDMIANPYLQRYKLHYPIHSY